MALPTHNFLNRVLPMSLRQGLRRLAIMGIPTMRHLDMPVRLAHLARLGFDPRVIVDIGAASGEWARLAAKVWPRSRIIGFEPNSRERAALERTKAELPAFDYRLCFLGPTRGTVNYEDKGTQTSLYYEAENRGGAQQSAMCVLDELIESGDVPMPDLMKLDVQGYELEVLRGAERAMTGAQGILLEVSWCRFTPGLPLVADVVAFMSARGFVWYDVMGILRRPADDALWQMDVLFLRAGHSLLGSEGFDTLGRPAPAGSAGR